MPERLRLVRVGVSEEYGPQQLGLAAVAVLAPVGFFCCLVLAGGAISWWWLVLAPVAIVQVPRAESAVPLVFWVFLIVVWFGAVPGRFTWWAVPAALFLAVDHTVLTLLAGRPTAGLLAAGTGRRVRSRLQVVAAVTVGTAALAQSVLVLALPGQLALAVTALALLAGWIWWGGRSVESSTG
jgi:hypothetical protein